jgi:hypothetical protein
VVDLPSPTTLRVSVIYLRSFWVLRHYFSAAIQLRQSLGTHSKPEREIWESVELFTSSRLPKLHCSIQIINKYSLKKLPGIETLSQVQCHVGLHLRQRKDDMK